MFWRNGTPPPRGDRFDSYPTPEIGALSTENEGIPMLSFPTRDGCVLRGPLAQTWVTDGGAVAFGPPQVGETCIFRGTRQQCEEFIANSYHAAMTKDDEWFEQEEQAYYDRLLAFEAGERAYEMGHALKAEAETAFTPEEYREYRLGFYSKADEDLTAQQGQKVYKGVVGFYTQQEDGTFHGTAKVGKDVLTFQSPTYEGVWDAFVDSVEELLDCNKWALPSGLLTN